MCLRPKCLVSYIARFYIANRILVLFVFCLYTFIHKWMDRDIPHPIADWCTHRSNFNNMIYSFIKCQKLDFYCRTEQLRAADLLLFYLFLFFYPPTVKHLYIQANCYSSFWLSHQQSCISRLLILYMSYTLNLKQKLLPICLIFYFIHA